MYLEPALRRRLKDAADCKGVSVSEYCRIAIEREVSMDEANGAGSSEPHDTEAPVLFGDAGEVLCPDLAVDRLLQARVRWPNTGMTLEEVLASRHEGHRY